MIFGAIMAGGVGSRMKISDLPKQFLPLGEKPIVIHTIEKFLLCKRFDKIYIGTNPSFLNYLDDMIKKHLPSFYDELVIVPGGTDRNGTLMNVIARIEEDFGERDDHIIVSHDAVRPFITAQMLEDNIDAAIEFGACDTVSEAIDTIVESVDGEFVTTIPKRKNMYQGQTPQSFKISIIKKLYNELSDDEKAILTDACMICALRNQPIKLVRGNVANIKITTVNDYKIAQIMATKDFDL